MPDTIVQATMLIVGSVIFIIAAIVFLRISGTAYEDLSKRGKIGWWITLAVMAPSLLAVLFVVVTNLF